MKPKILLCLALVLSGGLFGCAPIPKNLDIRAQLLASARNNDPDFPDGREVMLTHFSYLGQLVTSRGEIIHVADQQCLRTTRLSCTIIVLKKLIRPMARPLWDLYPVIQMNICCI